MTYHLFGNIITPRGVAANNRGETEGNRTTLPKVFWGDRLHVAVSAEAIRWAMRYFWQMTGCEVNRVWDEDEQTFDFIDQDFDSQKYIDDDVMGYMYAKKGKGGSVKKRRGALEVTRAVSLQTADKIEITFNSISRDKGKSGGKDEAAEKARTSIYSTETITTRFQYGMAITPQSLKEQSRITQVVEAITKLSNVGGNHGRFLYDFSPESVIFRWTHHPVPQFLYCFEQPDADTLTAPRLKQLIECEEIPASEIWIFGGYAFTEEAENLKQLGVNVYPSIRKGSQVLISQIQTDLNQVKTSEKSAKAG
ncbi:MAG: type I-B CRISPR-associated protein Cas7/Cst2/DevR [Xenococcaceae cyanobacterium MO_188.B32]|nr:type I-B CRISPR-associated protein Cas7/Cst2/DevR [Xenococcaceae cyanobacterium MO_188.B32]